MKGFFFVGFTLFSISSIAQEALSLETSLEYEIGRAFFEKNWVSAPSSTTASDGLGPLYNARSCEQCHNNAGAGQVENSLTIKTQDEILGQQIQNFAIVGLKAEAKISIEYELETIVLSASEEVLMHHPKYSLVDNSTSLLEQYSPRIASSLAGLGVLEQIPFEQIQKNVDEEDENSDGISGRINWISSNKGDELKQGRFGWKAGQVSLKEQTARALSLDIGISSSLYPNPNGDCTTSQKECLASANGNSKQHDNLEASNILMQSLMFFVNNVPAPRRSKIENIQTGEILFTQAGCADCHIPQYELRNVLVSPYSDLLLHDMGEGLADNLNEGSAKGNEWRTAPLWGIGSSKKTEYLHDGRAKSLSAAILWHSGEGNSSAQRFKSMTKNERDGLIRFLNSL